MAMTSLRRSARIVSLLPLIACSAAPPDEHDGHAGMTPGASGQQVVVDKVTAETLGIRSEPASAGAVEVSIRAPAMVSWDAHRVVRLTAQPGGQIRDLRLPLPGESIKAGALVARMYEPTVRAAFEELLVAESLGDPFVSAARSRLGALGVPRSEIEQALSSDVVPETYSVFAPTGGVVVQHVATAGTWVEPGGQLGVIAGSDAIVVEMVVTGSAPAPRTEVVLSDAATGATWQAHVTAQLPTADAAGTRIRLMAESPPPVGRPLIAEWTEIVIEGVFVPSTAVVDTGERRVVFVRVAPDRFEPRRVSVGATNGTRVQILDGLGPGEEVVVSGTFLLDSETQIGAGGHAAHGG